MISYNSHPLLLTLSAFLIPGMIACNDPDAPSAPPALVQEVPGGGAGGATDWGEGDETSGGPGGAGGARPFPAEDEVCGGLDCGPRAACREAGGAAVCQCLSGYAGEECDDIDECQTAGICGESGRCTNYPGTHACSCPSGMKVGEGGCEDVDECELGFDACDEDASCQNALGTHICTCEPGLFGDGTFCKESDDCAGSPCGPGTCRNTPSGYSCSCPLGTSGPNCSLSCPLNAPIEFESSALAAAVRRTVGLLESSPITPAHLASVDALFVPPPISSEENINSLAGLACWPTLKTLDLRGHTTQDLTAIRSLGALETLNLECSESDDFTPLSDLARLRSLNLSKGSLCGTTQRSPKTLNFIEALTQLRHFEANGSGLIEDLSPLSSLSHLHTLRLRATNLGELGPLAKLSSLQMLDLSENPVSDVTALSQLPLLTDLHLSSTQIDDVSALGSASLLQTLYIEHTQIDELDPLAPHASLTFLYAKGNELSDLAPLASMPSLISADLEGNEIRSVEPLAHSPHLALRKLRLVGNPLDCDEQADALFILRSRGITVDAPCE